MSDFEDDHDPNGHGFDRRQFGKILVWGVGGLSLAARAGAQSAKPPGATVGSGSYDVIIVGAGLSGLIAARELQRTKLNILMLEAGDRVGGRMFGEEVTANGKKGYIDYGGQWVGPTQTAMLALLDQLGIKKFISYEKGKSLQSWKPDSAKDAERTVFNGDVSNFYMGQCTPPDPHDYPKNALGNVLSSCSAANVPCSPDAKEQKIWLEKLLEDISVTVPCDKPWKTFNAPELDRKTFQQFLKENGAEGYTQFVPTVAAHIGGSGGFETDQTSLLHMAWTQHVAPQSETPEKWLIDGGAGQIPGILAKQLTRVPIYTSLPVRAIENYDTNDGPRVAVVTSIGEVYHARAVIVAIPPPMRQKIDIPNLPTSYVGFMYGSPMGSMSKVHFIYDKAFWRCQCLSGSAVGNLKTCEFIADSSSPDGEPGILTSFIAADCNVGLRHATKEQVRDLVLEDYRHFFGNEALNYKDFYYKNWNNATWEGGAFTSYTSPGVWTRYGEEGWRKPFGSIFWAGTETSERWPGYFDGAIRAGVRAANEVMAKLNVARPQPLNPPWPDPSCPTKVDRINPADPAGEERINQGVARLCK